MLTSVLPWQPFPVMTLTVRQFLAGRSARVVTVLAFLPALFALIYRINSDWATPFTFLTGPVFLELFSPTLLPIMVLILATSALGNEIEDRTLPYLTLKPRSRGRIVLEKYAGVVIVAWPAITVGLVVAWLIARGAPGPARLIGRGLEAPDLLPVLWAMITASTVGILAFTAIFLAVSLFIPRALLAGMIYAFGWESLLGRFLPGIRIISVRHYVQSIFVRMVDDPLVTLDNAFTLSAAVWTMAITVGIALAVAIWRLGRLNLD